MATEVGVIQAGLTLDMSQFRAGMAEAASLAGQLSTELQSAMRGGTGFSDLTRDVMALIEQMNVLRGELYSWNAAVAGTSSAALFAEMRNYTASMGTSLDSVASNLSRANTEAQSLASSLQQASAAIDNISNTADLLSFGGITVPTDFTTPLNQLHTMAGLMQQLNQPMASMSSIDFSVPLSQLQAMLSVATQLVTLLTSIGSVDLETGELTGGEQVTNLHIMAGVFQQIAETITAINDGLVICIDTTKTWLMWVDTMATRFTQIKDVVNTISILTGTSKEKYEQIAHENRLWRQDSARINKQAGQLNKNLQTTKGYAVSIKGIIAGIVISQAFYTMSNMMQELVVGSLKFSQNMQDAGVAFQYLMADSAVSSEAFLNALKDIALQSPLDTTDLTSASRKLMAMGFSAESTVPALQILTDTAAVFSNSAGDMSDQIDHIALAFGQMIAAGKVSAQELRQLYNAGLPVYELLADGLGISMEMAKNIGHYNVNSAEAVYAILKQLQKRYAGASASLAQTMSGSLANMKESFQQILAYSWQGIFDNVTEGLAKIAQYMRALVKITQAYGPGGLFQALIPESAWDKVRLCIAGIQQLGQAIVQLFLITKQAFGDALGIALNIGSVILPTLGTIARVLTTVARAAIQAYPVLRSLLSVIALMVIAGVVAKAVMVLGKALWILTGAQMAAKAIVNLYSALTTILKVSSPAAIAIMAIAAALLALVVSSEKARAALANFFGGIRDQVGSFADSLDLGFDISDIAVPEFDPPDTSDFSDGLDSMTSEIEDFVDGTEDAAKAVKKNLQSFDEVFTIDNSDDAGTSGALDGLTGALGDIGNLDYSDLFDWTGDWASDWGKLSADIGDLGDVIGDVFGDLSSFASDFWEKLSAAFAENPSVAGSLIGASIGAVLGGLLGGPAGALIGAGLGALAGWVTSEFWQWLADEWNLEPDSAVKATAATGIGAGIGALIGFALGGTKASAILGAALGGVTFGLGTMIWEKLKEDFNISDEAGQRSFVSDVVDAIIVGVTEVVKELVKQITSGKVSFSSIGTAFKGGLKMGILSALANFALTFLTQWIVGSVGEAVGKSEEEIARGEEWASWGGSILGTIGTIIGTVVGGPLGGLIGGLLGQAAGALIGGGLGLFWDDIKAFFAGVWDAIKTFFGTTLPEFFEGLNIVENLEKMWDGAVEFFTVTIPGWFDDLWTNVSTFFGTTLPEFLGGVEVGSLLTNMWNGVVEFFTVTIPGWFDDLWTNISTFFGTTLPEFFGGIDIGETIKGIWDGVWEFFTVTIPEWFSGLGEDISLFFTETVPKLFYDAGHFLGEGVGTVARILVDFFTKTIPEAFDDFVGMLVTFFTETIPEAWNDFTEALDEFFGGIWEAVSTFVTETIPEAFNDFVNMLVEFFTVTIPKAWDDFTKALGEFFNGLWETVSKFFTETLPKAFDDFVNSLVEFFTVTIPQAWDDFTQALGEFFDGLWETISTFFTETIPKAFDDFINSLVEFFTVTIPQAWDDFIQSLGEFFGDVWDAIVTFITETIPEAFNDFIDALVKFFTEDIPKAWDDFITSLGEFFNNLIQDFVEFFTVTLPQKWEEFVNTVIDLGGKIIDGIIKGFEDTVGTVWEWIKEFGSGFIDGFKDAFGIHSPADTMIPMGENIINGVIEGLIAMANTMPSELNNNVFGPMQQEFSTNLAMQQFLDFGKNVVQGLINGVMSLASSLASTVSRICSSITSRIQSALRIHSPSGVTTEYGQYIDQGLINGMLNLAGKVGDSAAAVAGEVNDNMQFDDTEIPAVTMESTSSNVLTSLTSWSDSFISIVAYTLDSIASMFETLDSRLLAATGNLNSMPSAIGAKIGSISAADNLVASSDNTSTGTSEVLSVIADLTEGAVDRLSDRMAVRIYELLAPLFSTMDPEDQQATIAYVGTLIADDNGLKELERKLRVIQVSEGRRR